MLFLKAADWKNAGTFAKFYQRETSSVGQFAQAVLTVVFQIDAVSLSHE